MYQQYIVHAFKVSLTVNTQLLPATNNNGLAVCLRFRANGASQFASFSSNVAAPHSVARLIPNFGSGDPVVMSMYSTTAAITGQSPQTVASADSFSALYNADPSSLCIADIGVVDINATNNLKAGFIIRITQWLELFSRATVV